MERDFFDSAVLGSSCHRIATPESPDQIADFLLKALVNNKAVWQARGAASTLSLAAGDTAGPILALRIAAAVTALAGVFPLSLHAIT